MAEFGVGFKLYADAQGFVTGTKEAQESAKTLKNELKETFGESGLFSKISVIGAITGIATGLLSAANAAQELRDKAKEAGTKLDENTERVARFGDALDSFKSGAQSALLSVVGYFNMLGEKVADTILYWKGIGEAEQKAIADVEKQTVESLKRIEEARKANSPEKVAEAERKLAEFRESETIRRADGEKQIALLLQQQNRLRAELSELGSNTVKAKEKEIEIEKNVTALRDAQANYLKDFTSKTEKLNKEKEKASDDELKALRQQQQLQERLADARFTQLSTDEKILAVQADIAATQNRIYEDEKLGNSTAEDKIKLIEKQNQLLDLQKQIVEETSKIPPPKTAQKETRFGFALKGMGQFGEASDEALQEFISRSEQRAITLGQDPEALKYDRAEIARLKLEAQNARKELEFRESLRRDVQSMGLEGARGSFRGDPLAFDTLVQRFVTDSRSTQEIQKEQTDQLRDLNARLSKFGLTK